jgi:addiction module HigA family antidote
LTVWDAARRAEDLNLPGFDFHPLHGVPIRYSVDVNGAWCLTFEFAGDAFADRLPTVPLGTAMTEHTATRNPHRCPTHPGELLRETVIPATGRTKTEIARLLGISPQHLHDILEERKPVSAAVAVRLGKLFGDGAGVWLRMQAAYDVWHAEREVDTSGIQTLRVA